MVQPVTDNVEFLAKARNAVLELSEIKQEAEKQRIEEKRLEKALESEKKAVADSISITVKKRLDGINSSYDQEISKGQDRLKKARGKREKAKSQGIRDRIDEETKELRDHNKELRLKMKTLFQQSHVPAVCKSTIYYSLYHPAGPLEIFILLFTVVLCFLAAPYGIYSMTGHQSTLILALIYFICFVVFGGIYVLFGNQTKVYHQESLTKGRAIRDLIRSNNKKIRVIIGSIKRDRDEAAYNLKVYDDQIAQIQQELNEVTNKKREAINTFDKVTRTIICDEITSSSKPRIDSLTEDYEKTVKALANAEALVKQRSLFIADNYESYVGKEFLTADKLDELSKMIRGGQAENISEAVALCRSEKN